MTSPTYAVPLVITDHATQQPITLQESLPAGT